ncbi:hypothetical protein F0919_17210 [Taibaiella lutea]|uniref:Uncharacterized protein n=1 Tax=Taibaiella lutea TaxID=2608001 RepID=A0A5M6CF39_9BACT|nr:hypothetical protein [Taibaiella lutea]KAA5532522.1 hypothetical protein F0919_17210 [Taibaiella lutea]
MLNNEYSNLNKVLFNNSKLIENKNNIEKNISEGLLTFRTLVIISPFINETEESAQLEKILAACKLQSNDYNVSVLTNDWSYFRNAASIKEILLFGVSEKDLNLNILMPFNQVIRFDNRVWIKSSSIAEMMKSQEIKNNLWQNALKPHFLG